MYKNRIPDGHIAIGSANYGDLICMSPNGGVFHWDHEVHDLYFNNDGNGYQPQNIKLESIANSFHEFKELIGQTDIIVDDQEIDDALNPETPFSDSSLDFDFKNPKLFFLSPKNSIDIHLKKLTLSERGRQLIEKFKHEGLM